MHFVLEQSSQLSRSRVHQPYSSSASISKHVCKWIKDHVSFLQSAVLVDLVGVQHAGRGTAIMMLFIAISMMASIPLAGFIYDTTSNYSYSFYTMGTLQTLGGIVLLASICLKTQNVESNMEKSGQKDSENSNKPYMVENGKLN